METFRAWKRRMASEGTVIVCVTPGWREKLGLPEDGCGKQASRPQQGRRERPKELTAAQKQKQERLQREATVRADEAAAALLAEIEAEGEVTQAASKQKSKPKAKKKKKAPPPQQEAPPKPPPAPEVSIEPPPVKLRARRPTDPRCQLFEETQASIADCALDADGSHLAAAWCLGHTASR